ncbi:MAG: adenylate/guanylate cyclase domain-containing protein [Dehalococcoidia bacterium]|nr:adenylate/guanylate cyclase domain-containing protein [Dehalococcoidia bacterium]
MEGRIQYATSPDGVSIAFSVMGDGPPLIHATPIGWCSTKLELMPYVIEYMYAALAERYTFIRFDPRGTGLSDRDIPPLTAEVLASDIGVVADRLKLERFDLFAVSSMGPPAIAYAATHPERVSHLVLHCSSAVGRDIQSSSRLAIDSLAKHDWRIYTETYASAAMGWADADDARKLAQIVRDTSSAEQRTAFYEVIRAMDVTDQLPRVKSPALVIHNRGYSLVPASCATRLAAQLPDADMVLFEGNSLFPSRLEVQLVMETIDTFLGGMGGFEAPPPLPGQAASVTGLRTILFTDVEGSTALTQRLGDQRARLILRQHERITRQALADYGGSEVKALGDGFMASFESASKALECAVAMQQSFETFNSLGNEPIRVRIGVNAGEPIAEGADLYGTAVNLAARIAGQAKGAQVLVSDVVRQLVAGKGFLFSDHGDVVVRGFEDPVRLYELRWGGSEQGASAGGPAARPGSLDAWREAYFSED